jgi:hypothetical protein
MFSRRAARLYFVCVFSYSYSINVIKDEKYDWLSNKKLISYSSFENFPSFKFSSRCDTTDLSEDVIKKKSYNKRGLCQYHPRNNVVHDSIIVSKIGQVIGI